MRESSKFVFEECLERGQRVLLKNADSNFKP